MIPIPPRQPREVFALRAVATLPDAGTPVKLNIPEVVATATVSTPPVQVAAPGPLESPSPGQRFSSSAVAGGGSRKAPGTARGPLDSLIHVAVAGIVCGG